MSYLVLARKWRPQTFDEVVGQTHVTKTLQNAIRLKRIAHAYLFTGARGVGKTSVARILAKALNCERGVSPSSCNTCSNCQEITQGNAMDVQEVDGASNRGIDSIRELRETVRYRPAKSRYKIYIIDEVHMLTDAAFNALLKTLEEPPEHVLFIFATTEPHKILSTILSRCQRFDFRRISTRQIVDHLKDILVHEKMELSEGVVYSVAREADGSMRDAQSLLEQLLSFSGDGLSDEEILDVLGVIDRRSVHRVGEAILAEDVRTCLDVVGDLYRRGIDSRRFCQQLCDHFRSLLFFAFGGGEGGSQLDLPEEEKKLLMQQASNTNPETLYLYFQMVLKGEEEIRRSSMPRVALEMLLLRLTQLPRLESLEGVLKKLTALEGRLAADSGCELQEKTTTLPRHLPTIQPPITNETPPVDENCEDKGISQGAPVSMETETSESPTPGSDVVTSSADAVQRWPDFLQWLQKNDVVLAAKLNQSEIQLGPDESIEVEVLEIFENAIKEPQALSRLAEATTAFFGRKFQWTVRGRPSLQRKSEEPHKAKRPKTSPKRLVMENPVVQQALELLGGELIEIRSLESDQTQPKKGRIPLDAKEGAEFQ